MSKEGLTPFNPADPKYKRVEDLPKAFQDDYVDAEGGEGFIPKSADDTYKGAEKLAYQNQREGNLGPDTAMGVLREDAEKYDAARTNLLKAIQEYSGRPEDLSERVGIERAFAEQPDLAADKGFMLKILNVAPDYLKNASPELRNDKEVVLSAITSNKPDSGNTGLHYASEQLKRDKDVLVAAVNNGGVWKVRDSIQGTELVHDRDIALGVVRESMDMSLDNFPDFIDDDEVVLAGVPKGSGFGMKQASERLRGDKKFALEAVALNPGVFSGFSEEIQNDPEVVLMAIAHLDKLKEQKDREHFQFYLSDEIRANREVAVAMAEAGFPMHPKGEALQDDRELAKILIKNGFGPLHLLSDRLRGDKEIALGAIKNRPDALQSASEELRDDPEVVEAATAVNPELIKYASKRIQKSRKGGFFSGLLGKK